MAFQPETTTYEVGVYQWETTDPSQGGVGGVDNLPLLQLANRTKYLKQHIDNLESGATIPPTLAPINSPVLTGDPQAPTPALGDSDTSIATTLFVQNTVNGVLSKSVAGGSNVSLTAIEAGNGIFKFTGALTGNISVIVPNTNKRFVAWNATSGSFTLTVKTAAGTGIVIAQGKKQNLLCDGTNVSQERDDFTDTVLAGAPTAPTAAAGTNTTQVSTTAFVQTAVANLVNSSPTALDTLKELADALGDDPNFATTMTNALAAKAPLASPALTGTPTAPTAAGGTNTTQLATTAYVQGELAAKAPLASPALTGNPTAPTPAASDNDTSIATTQYVQNLVNGRNPVNVAGNSNVTLTSTQYGNTTITLSGALTGNISVIFPNINGHWIVDNQTSGNFTITCKTATGTGLTVKTGKQRHILNIGPNMVDVNSDYFGDTWTNVTGSRAASTTYTNNTSAYMEVKVWGTSTVANSSVTLSITVDGVAVQTESNISAGTIGFTELSVGAIVPPGSTYSVGVTQCSIAGWRELL